MSCNLIATHVEVSDGDLKAFLVPKNQENQEEDQENQEKGEIHSKALILSLSVYSDGILRLKIDEDPSLDPPKKRFEVPDVIESGFLEKKLWLESVENKGGLNVVYLNGEYEAVLRSDPFEVLVRGKDGKSVMSLNSHGLFDFEQLRVKKEGEDWEERWKGHTDRRPYGPQSISFDVSFYDVSFVYGIPEHATSLALKPTRGPGVDDSEPYRLFNLDVFEYLHESPFGLYGSIPFMLGHGKSRGTSGFFWLNAAEMQIDVLKDGWDAESSITLPSGQSRIDTFWMSEAGVVDAFFFVGPGPKDVIRQYTSVTGTSALPQLFATAYHQCRWNYRDEEDVQNVDSKFDEHDIPYDVLWLDIEHTDGKKYFTWDRALFPNPEDMQKKLAAKGRKMVTIVDPHIKRDNSYHIHKEATEKGYYVKDANGNDYDGWCWPGSSSYIDMVNPEIRSWWGEKFSYQEYVGSTPSLYIWNDMNEPSVFNGPEISMPRDALHYGNVEHRELHNAYGYYFHMATAGGLVKRESGNDRPFVLLLIPLVHNDYRERKTELIREAIHIRYMLLPYFYTLFREANVSGTPVVRPLWMEFPSDEGTFGTDEAFMVGNSILVQGIYTEGAKQVSVYLPGEQSWYDMRTGTAYTGGVTHKLDVSEEAIPAFQRAGTIIPRKDRFRRSSKQMENDPYTLVIALNSSREAEGELYVDDGKSFAFQQGSYIHRRFVFSNGKLTSINLAPAATGKSQFVTDCTVERIILLGHSPAHKGALVEPSNQKADVEDGPLMLRPGRTPAVPTIRKPGVRITDDWTIRIL
uniref:Glucosidase II subunit alpha n=1 Tax=Daucus carota subsp. sativus TaxID=79200 RepID=A0A164X3E7_DAUCS